MLALTLVRVLRETFAQNRAGRDASIDSAAATAVTAIETKKIWPVCHYVQQFDRIAPLNVGTLLMRAA